jgi:hypothetical protein
MNVLGRVGSSYLKDKNIMKTKQCFAKQTIVTQSCNLIHLLMFLMAVTVCKGIISKSNLWPCDQSVGNDGW